MPVQAGNIVLINANRKHIAGAKNAIVSLRPICLPSLVQIAVISLLQEYMYKSFAKRVAA